MKQRKTIPGQKKKTLTKTEIRRREFKKRYGDRIKPDCQILKIGGREIEITDVHMETSIEIDSYLTPSRHFYKPSLLTKTTFECYTLEKNLMLLINVELPIEIICHKGVYKSKGWIDKIDINPTHFDGDCMSKLTLQFSGEPLTYETA